MTRPTLRVGLVLVALAVLPHAAPAQINFTVTYADGNITPGTAANGFADGTISGSTTIGQLRRDSVDAAIVYLKTVLDGRGTSTLNFTTSLNNSGSGVLASFGPRNFVGVDGSFQNGAVYQTARSSINPFSGAAGQGEFNFGKPWVYFGQTGSGFDMVTVVLHEFGHGLGFLSGTASNGQGLSQNTVGTPDIYTVFDMSLQRGNSSSGTPQFNTTISSSNYGAFTGSVSILTAGNDASTGLFFGGKYTMDVRNGVAASIFAPSSYQGGSSTSHVNDTSAVMNPSIGQNVIKRSFLAYEIAMLMDIGWNVYNWDNGAGNWLDGVTVDGNGDTTGTTLSASNWRTDKGIAFANSTVYNSNTSINGSGAGGQAPIHAPYGKVSSNIVLKFGGSGSGNYTSTNNIATHDFRLSRLELASTSTHATGNTITGGTLLFGRNSDGTDSVLKPKIEQSGSGRFIINSTINIAQSANGLTVDGTGSGQVTLGGQITGVGMLTRGGTGSFVLVLSNNTNDYSGGTAVSDGILRLGAADVIPDSGVFRLAGGTLSTGASAGNTDVLGSFQLTSSSTIAMGTGSHSITFSGITGTPSGTLTVTGWSGVQGVTGNAGKIYFQFASNYALSSALSDYASFLNNTAFTGVGSVSTFIDSGVAGRYELIPIPEPSTVLGLAAFSLVATSVVRRRISRKVPSDLPTTVC